MTTRVVNVHYDRYDVYIGRGGRGQDGYFGNPYRRYEKCSRCGLYHDSGGSTIPCFINYFYDRITVDLEYRTRVLSLEGCILGCFCKPLECHGDIYAAWLDFRPR